MGIRIEIVMLVGVLSLVISMTTQGSVFDNNKAVGSVLTYVQNNGEKLTRNNLEQSSSTVTEQSSSDTNQASFKNTTLPSTASTTQSTNLKTIFKQVENSIVQITRKLPSSASTT